MDTTAEAVAALWAITCGEQDALAVESQRRAAADTAYGYLKTQIPRITV